MYSFVNLNPLMSAYMSCFPFLRVMTLAFSLGFMMVWEGSLPDPCALIWLISLAIWPIWYSKFFWDKAKVLTSSSSEEFWLDGVA